LEARKYARWAKDNIDEVFEAKIVDIDDKPEVELTNSMVGVRMGIENYEGERLLEKLKVRIISSDIISKQIVARIL
jgi:hypothetical protein